MKKEKSSYYSLDDMLNIFKDHSTRNHEQMKKDREEFPDAEWVKQDFNISKAFHSICHEIDLLKNPKPTVFWDENI